MRETPQTEIQYQDKKNEVKNFLDGNYISWKKIGLEEDTRETGAENEGGSDRRGQGRERGKGEREIDLFNEG
jgi:hypothetical protein